MTDNVSPEAAGIPAGGPAPLRAIVVFHDKGAGFWPWLFGRPGFRHCFVALNDGRAWIVCDPRSDRLSIEAETDAAFDLAGFYRQRGFTVVEAAVDRDSRPFLLPFAVTCVETVKRVLGLHGWWVWTPHQLHRRLRWMARR